MRYATLTLLMLAYVYVECGGIWYTHDTSHYPQAHDPQN